MPRHKTLHVLLVEDNPADASLIKGQLDGLQERDVVVRVCEDVAGTRRYMARKDAAVDIILLDLQLPDSTGLATLDQVREICGAKPVVVLTGNEDEALATEALRHGAQDYLVKGDYQIPLLLRSVRYAVQRFGLEQSKRESDRRYRELVEELPVGVLLTTLEGVILQANPAATLLLAGDAQADVAGARIQEFYVDPQDRHRHLVQCRAQEGAAAMDIEIRNRDGRTIWIRDTGRIGAEPGTGPVLRSTLEDRTAKRLAQTAERVALEQKMEIERLEEASHERTRLLRTAAHELNTPLMPLQWEIHLLATKRLGPLTEEQAQAIASLGTNIERLARLVDDVVDVNRLQAGRFTLAAVDTDMIVIMQGAIDSFRNMAASRHITLTLHGPDKAPLVADGDRLSQVAYNLIANAVHYSPPDTTIQVRVEASDAGISVSVHDAGIGIDADGMSRLFTPFARVHDPANIDPPGSGLGLFICRGIVEEHGGSIWCESDGLGRGSTFTFQVPPSPGGVPRVAGATTATNA